MVRFNLPRAAKEAQPIRELLSAWAKQNLPHLKDLPPCAEADFPPNLSPRRQDLCEPLLQLADAVGGQWPECARQALTAVFAQEAAFDLQPALQLLDDVRQCFQFHSFPERLSTSTLMDWIRTLPARPWDADGPLTPRAFARLLLAFDVRPRLQRVGQDGPARGYQLHDFLEPWRRHLGQTAMLKVPCALPKDYLLNSGSKACPQDDAQSVESKGSQPPTAPESAKETGLEQLNVEAAQPKIANQKSEIPNRNGVCNGIAKFPVNGVAALQNPNGETQELR